VTIAAPEPGGPGWLALALVVSEPGDWTAAEAAQEVRRRAVLDLGPGVDGGLDRIPVWFREWRRPVRIPGTGDRVPLIAPSLVRAFPGPARRWYWTKVQRRIMAALFDGGPCSLRALAERTGGAWTNDRGQVRTHGTWDRAFAGLVKIGDAAPPSAVWPTPAAVSMVGNPPSWWADMGRV
jgi:hypothetical protein